QPAGPHGDLGLACRALQGRHAGARAAVRARLAAGAVRARCAEPDAGAHDDRQRRADPARPGCGARRLRAPPMAGGRAAHDRRDPHLRRVRMSEYTFDRYTLVLLRRPANAPDLPEEELDRIQDAHLAFLAAGREAGHIAVAGPFMDQTDESLRGLII